LNEQEELHQLQGLMADIGGVMDQVDMKIEEQ